MNAARFAKYAWFLLLYNLAAVAWGVYVRASGSGDGCGRNWPLCDGASIPTNGAGAKLVELSHRVSTEAVGLFAVVLVIWAFRAFPKAHAVRKATVFTLCMTMIEALIGMVLVKYKLVVDNDSAARAVVMSFHVVSTFLLIGSIAFAAICATEEQRASDGTFSIALKGQKSVGMLLALSATSMVLLAISGAVSALGHQLKPTDNVLKAALDPATFWMVRIQPLHPLLAISVGLYLALAGSLIVHLRPDARVREAVRWMLGIYCIQLGLGAVNIWAKAPIGMQMLHLTVADINWLSLVAVSVYALSAGIERVETRPAPESLERAAPLRGWAVVNAYLALTKPRVISLLLFTTLAAMVAARGEWPGTLLFFAVGIGGYMAAGSANAINMVIDRDIDFAMIRTQQRPTVTQSIPTQRALLFAFTLAAGSFAILWSVANLLAAVMAFSGLVFYIVVYTMMLKRRTWHNIVIGGAAGAFPPLVGWAAVTNDLPPLSLYLFAIIFVWTPVHFWALALLLKDEYAAAGVPMLPVVKGERNTVTQIAAYALLTFVVTLLPFLYPHVGWIYACTAVVLNCILLYLCAQLYRQVSRPRASSLFHYSMVYLAFLFLMFAIDRVVVMS